ncbi:acyltransferase family protein [Puniceibacterium sediminis]|uniref:Peptidoglycan/LPS O-acetylase OafA/YrhL, contains acyltransferase and SGNH-hydrolase domains n=1 Tax=Puniceibacterium sediminis TaxID=1608407 RepID=A0A238X0C4_9RHOB|nr:acyltransferase family protein [Puniceibacterium sediminis]SNR52405.1 Peptidoglycan/LPS O-acetylase OafA/YrhL, contains acyltransferase and SGNH-hydrolase domains [Puniceibacterium sediminis]
MKYRSDIDGLRAIAVLPVVLFHAGFSGIKGGFIGVDVFFVISGYLITTIIYEEARDGRFSFLDFYERRLRRIIPALFALIAFVILGSLFFLLPSELRLLPAQVIGAIFFVVNIVLWLQSGYFSPLAEEKPLLHTWSLGVEEQFYIFAPIILILVLRLAPQFLKFVLFFLTAVSFAFCAILTQSYPESSFYLLPTRAWELSAGSLIAVGIPSRPGSRLACEILTTLGIGLILAGVVLIDSDMAFPGTVAAVPVLGAVMVILCGEGTRAGAILGWRPIRWIGLISYSLYLWHWPLIVFARDGGWLNGLASQSAVVVISILMAWLSWRFIELPFRDKIRVPRRSIMAGSAIGMAAVTVLAIGIHKTDGWPERFSDDIARFGAAIDDVSPERERCHPKSGIAPPSEACTLGDGIPFTAVWGDSHGVELSYALSELIPVRQITYSGCPPVIGFKREKRPLCDEHNEEVIKFLIDPASNIRTVILTLRFDTALKKPGFQSRFAETVERLAENGLYVIVVAQLPTPGVSVPAYLARGGEQVFPFSAFEPIHSPMMTYLKKLDGAVIFDPAPIICPGADCHLVLDGAPTLFDANHPSMSVSRTIAATLVDRFFSAP